MSYSSKGDQGLDAIKYQKWDEAVEKLSDALAGSPKNLPPNPTWLIARSKALVGLDRFQDSLDDANLAWHAEYNRKNRKLLAEAQYRRAVAYLRLRQYANADACCIYAIRLHQGAPAIEKNNPAEEGTDDQGFYTVTLEQVMAGIAQDEAAQKNSGLSMAMGGGGGQKPAAQLTGLRTARILRTQILSALKKLPPGDEGRRLTATPVPEQKDLVDQASKETADEKPVAAAPPPASLRIQDFQSNTTMSVSIFSKGVDKEKLQVEYLPTAVILNAVIYPDGTEKEYRLDLFGEIDTSASRCAVTPNKVELTLKKKKVGKWAKLTSDAKPTSDVKPTGDAKLTSDSKPEPDAATLRKQAEYVLPCHGS